VKPGLSLKMHQRTASCISALSQYESAWPTDSQSGSGASLGLRPVMLGTMDMTEADQKREDDVLRRMLNTPPKPHKPLGKKKKPPSG
jgi:hypothetical protein